MFIMPKKYHTGGNIAMNFLYVSCLYSCFNFLFRITVFSNSCVESTGAKLQEEFLSISLDCLCTRPNYRKVIIYFITLC